MSEFEIRIIDGNPIPIPPKSETSKLVDQYLNGKITDEQYKKGLLDEFERQRSLLNNPEQGFEPKKDGLITKIKKVFKKR